MEAKQTIAQLKERFFDSVTAWAEERIDEFVASNPGMSTVSVYIKRGIKNYIARERGQIDRMIDNATLFLCDENGKVDVDTAFDDLLTMFRNMDEVPFPEGFIEGSVGKGVIRLSLPKNFITSLVFGQYKAIRITDVDLIALKKLLTVDEIVDKA